MQAYSGINAAYPTVIPLLTPEQIATADVAPPGDDLSTRINRFQIPSFNTAGEIVPGTEIGTYDTTVLCKPASKDAALLPPPAAPASVPAAIDSASGPAASAQPACTPDGDVVRMTAGSVQQLVEAFSAPAASCHRVVSLDPGPECVPSARQSTC